MFDLDLQVSLWRRFTISRTEDRHTHTWLNTGWINSVWKHCDTLCETELHVFVVLKKLWWWDKIRPAQLMEAAWRCSPCVTLLLFNLKIWRSRKELRALRDKMVLTATIIMSSMESHIFHPTSTPSTSEHFTYPDWWGKKNVFQILSF